MESGECRKNREGESEQMDGGKEDGTMECGGEKKRKEEWMGCERKNAGWKVGGLRKERSNKGRWRGGHEIG